MQWHVDDGLYVSILLAGHRLACYLSPPQDGTSPSESVVDAGNTVKALLLAKVPIWKA